MILSDILKINNGHDKVYQMITFGSLRGKSAIREVARIMDYMSYSEINELSKCFPDEASIADELEEMDTKSVIMWALQNREKLMKKWCYLNEGRIEGEYAELFSLAMRIENTYKSIGKHPAGVIISNEPIENDAPITEDKEGNPIAGFEMSHLDKVGLVKFDVLGVNLLDKIMEITGGN